MATSTTWGVKVDSELKEKLTAVMKESGMEGQDFKYKEDNQNLTKALQKVESDLGQANILVKEKEVEISQIKGDKEHVEGSLKAEIEAMKEQHKEALARVQEKAELQQGRALLEQEQTHQKAVGELTEKFNGRIEELQDRITADTEKIQNLLEQKTTKRATKKADINNTEK